ncbi:uncharacterized protein PV07_00720 [Cladophialophora immunda]|uniref:Uncharacterized protein n=1 Tax=Cladophialophora immunda TaxID=569365 RepID=A0A0D2A0E5_9EURO|nr:uncharacterized protein PV07_00720 [Cladophialophora immunda]KIW33906.1 hypothetical protein PV07_00720 [Cladophialophora immunda]
MYRTTKSTCAEYRSSTPTFENMPYGVARRTLPTVLTYKSPFKTLFSTCMPVRCRFRDRPERDSELLSFLNRGQPRFMCLMFREASQTQLPRRRGFTVAFAIYP